DGDVVVERFLGELHAVAFFADTVGEQHDVLVNGLLRQDALVGLSEGGRDLGTAIGRDAADQLLDRRAIFGLADRHGPLEGVVEDEYADRIDGPQVLDYTDGGEARQLDLAALHRARFIDDQHYGGTLGRSRRRELGGQHALQRVVGLALLFHVDVA